MQKTQHKHVESEKSKKNLTWLFFKASLKCCAPLSPIWFWCNWRIVHVYVTNEHQLRHYPSNTLNICMNEDIDVDEGLIIFWFMWQTQSKLHVLFLVYAHVFFLKKMKFSPVKCDAKVLNNIFDFVGNWTYSLNDLLDYLWFVIFTSSINRKQVQN